MFLPLQQRSACSRSCAPFICDITGDCKTEASRKPVPLDERVAADLWIWKETSRYRQLGDWKRFSSRMEKT